MRDKILQTIKENNLIKKGEKIILGISGGPDSVCLFNILYDLKKELNIELVLAHVNYNYRGQDSILDEKFVRKLSKKFKIKLYCKKIKPEEYKNKKNVLELNSRYRELSSCAKNLEEYFREIRYEFFNKVLKSEKASKIAVAHNKDDQTETIIMHFMRGSGLQGLSGMKMKKNKIIRPLLNINKIDILAYLKQSKIKYREDRTNKDLKFTRNKIRHQLIPYLEREFNPNLRNTLSSNSKVIRDDQNMLLGITENIFKNWVKEAGGEHKINLKKFKDFDLALKRRLLQYILIKKFNKEISLATINEILKILENSKNGSKKIIKEIEIIKNYDKIVIRKRKARRGVGKISLKTKGETKLSLWDIKFIIKKVDRLGRISKNKCYIDQGVTGSKLFVRTRENGDKFYPEGMTGSQKLKDYFINKKVEQGVRNQVPLIVNDKNNIVWIVGFGIDRRFSAYKDSKKILEIQKIQC